MLVVGRLSGGINPDSGGTFVPPFKLLKYALKSSAECQSRQLWSGAESSNSYLGVPCLNPV